MSDILTALGNVFTIGNLAGLIFGTGAGILIGAMPGLSVNMGIALLFPLTFAFQGVGGILMLLGTTVGQFTVDLFQQFCSKHRVLRHRWQRHWMDTRWLPS